VINKNEEGLRVDRWLWFARFHKTRMLASAAVQGGHVRINGERAKPGNRVVPGDTVELIKDQLPYKLNVLSLPSRRGPAAEASACYEEDPDTERDRSEMRSQLKEDRRQMPRTRGRPDKHTRRMLRERNRRQPDKSG
jgi:ribosome-associated heat shock protein Hsp15